MAQAHRDTQLAAADLLDEIGPAILLTHSAGGPTGWLAADARPACVKGIVAVEPVGPPFTQRAGGTLVWGLTAAPLTFDPPAARPEDLKLEERAPPREGTIPCLVQQEPARRLPNLMGFPIVIVTSEASWMATDNHGTVDFLQQAGAQVEHVRLEERGVRGNGHAMMLETNSGAVAAVIENWIADKGLT
jgi:pimeloyl-ACP methyl ester carboxylesterase